MWKGWIMNRIEILEKIKEKEAAGDFNSHIVETNQNFKEVSPDYDYLRKHFWNQLGSCFAKPVFSTASFFIARYCHLKIYGKENLKKVDRAIVTTNHINNIDCALIRNATRGRKLTITVGEFNNYKGVFGSLLRAAGTMPFSDKPSCMRNISRAIKTRLEQKHLVVFYPEGSLWWCYRKPRPLQDGAFYFATKSNVAVLPMFFTFSDRKKRKDGTYKQNFYLHIGEPIYPKEELNLRENVEYLRKANEQFNQDTYNKFYGIVEENTQTKLQIIHKSKKLRKNIKK